MDIIMGVIAFVLYWIVLLVILIGIMLFITITMKFAKHKYSKEIAAKSKEARDAEEDLRQLELKRLNDMVAPLVCDNCGARLNQTTNVCEFCGTEHVWVE